MQAGLPPKKPEVADDKQGTPLPNQVSKPTKPLSQKALRQQRLSNQAAKRQKAKQGKGETHEANKAAKRAQQVLDRREGKKLSASALLEPLLGLPGNKIQDPLADSGPEEANEGMPLDEHSELGSSSKNEGPTEKVMSTVPEHPLKDLISSIQNGRRTRKVMTSVPEHILKLLESDYKKEQEAMVNLAGHEPQDAITEGGSSSKPTASARKTTTKKSLSEQARDTELQAKGKRGEKRLLETERKAELARKLGMKIRKHVIEHNPHFAAKADALSPTGKMVDREKDVLSRSKEIGTRMSDVAGFDSLQGALGRKAAKLKAGIEKADATQLEILRKD